AGEGGVGGDGPDGYAGGHRLGSARPNQGAGAVVVLAPGTVVVQHAGSGRDAAAVRQRWTEHHRPSKPAGSEPVSDRQRSEREREAKRSAEHGWTTACARQV